MTVKNTNDLQSQLDEAVKSLTRLEKSIREEDQENLEESPDMGDEMAPEAPEMGEEAPEMAPEAPEMGEEAPEMEEAPVDGEMGEEAPEEEDGIEQHLAGMADEDLQHVYEMVVAELDARAASQDDANQAQEGEDLQKMNNAQMEGMYKSIQTIASSVESLGKKIDSIESKAVVTPAPAKKRKISVKPVVTSNIQVLEKSEKAAKRLTKSETNDFLVAELRAKNPAVTSKMVAAVSAARNDEELHILQDTLKKDGIKLT